ncbi:MAG: CDP-archaeol synthase [Saprospiraceae bacterium]|nr:CDP-archaeol synthase [Saprospiraceae bacterium]
MLVRTVTGLLFGIVMIFSILTNLWTSLALVSIILVASFYEFSVNFTKSSTKTQFPGNLLGILALSLIATIFIFSIFTELLKDSVLIVTLVFNVLFIIFSSIQLIQFKISSEYFQWWIPAIYIGAPILIVSMFLILNYPSYHFWVLAVLIVIWTNDTMAYFTGKLFGKNKLAPSISPGKTIEGLIGGIVFGIIIGVLLNQFWIRSEFSILQMVLLSFMVGVFGILGDLFESQLKRLAGIKDSGKILPGHGGMLDRFDSFLFAIPPAFLYIWINQNY